MIFNPSQRKLSGDVLDEIVEDLLECYDPEQPEKIRREAIRCRTAQAYEHSRLLSREYIQATRASIQKCSSYRMSIIMKQFARKLNQHYKILLKIQEEL